MDVLHRARDAFQRQAWSNACALLVAADESAPLDRHDLELLGAAAFLTGSDDVSIGAWTRGYNEHVRAKDPPRAARCAFWMVMALMSSSEWARASGRLATAQRLLDAGGCDCPERGLLLVLSARSRLKNDDSNFDIYAEIESLAGRFDDADLTVFSLLARGLACARRGDTATAGRLFDETMVAATTREVSPMTVGTAYCAVIDGCFEIMDPRRAREWTEALARWCGAQPDLVPFRGHCLVHRAQTLRLCGDWREAMEEAERACHGSLTAGSPGGAARGYPAGAAFYELGELLRVRGSFAEANQAYRRANEFGRVPEPGLALLRLAEGHTDAAAAAIRGAFDQPRKPSARATVLSAFVEIMIAAGELDAARKAVDELNAMAAQHPASLLRANAAQSRGALELAEGDARGALGELRSAWMEWQALEMPYEAARVRVMMGRACRQLGDVEAAELELDAARRVFLRLEAGPDLERTNDLIAVRTVPGIAQLTRRELEVIKLLAAGKTNRAIGHELSISERTVDRHVSNILTKLDLPSRAAATAYAYRHDLL
jgi:DNA-binding CsgD family transcriptional regulator